MTDIIKPEQYTGPSEFVHLHSHTVFSALDGVATPEQYAEACQSRKYPAMSATEHGHMASVPDMHLAFKKQGVQFIPGCFLPSQPILTDQGVKDFQDVQFNDQVLTHLGRFRPVNNVQVRPYQGDVIRIRAWGIEPQVCTPEHPLLVKEKTAKEGSMDWRTAQYLYDKTTGHRGTNEPHVFQPPYQYYLCVPRLLPPSPSAETTRSLGGMMCWDPYAGSYGVSEEPKDIISTSPEDTEHRERFLWMLGYWLAAGSVVDGKIIFNPRVNTLSHCVRIHKFFHDYNVECSHITEYMSDTPRSMSGMQIIAQFSSLAQMLSHLFDPDPCLRHIPLEWLYHMDSSQSEAMLQGIRDSSTCADARSNYIITRSRTLAWQVRILLSKLQEPWSSPISNLKHDQSYTLYCGDSTPLGPDSEDGVSQYQPPYNEQYLYLPIYDVQRETYEGQVYNMEVHEDNSYYTGVAAHNCEIYYNDYEPQRQSLVAQGCKIRSKQWREENPELFYRIARNRHLTVLCKNMTGFHNLVKLTTQAYRKGLFGMGRAQYNRVWFEQLCKHKEGLIILSGCLNGPLSHELRYRQLTDKEGNVVYERDSKTRLDDTITYLRKFKKAFGEDYFIEIQMPGVEDDEKVFRDLVQIADKFKIKTVLTNDTHYLSRDDYILQKMMMAVSQETTIDSPDLFHVNSDDQFLKSRAELWSTFKNKDYSKGLDDDAFEQACNNTLLIAERCEPFQANAAPKYPQIPKANDELRRLVAMELRKRGLDKCKDKFIIDGDEVTYVEQSKIELNRFIEKGFASYFLITQDLIQYGKKQGWPFSPRGSAGGSLVCFLLGIHVLDPLRWNLSFDRFLSPSRGGYILNVRMPEAKN